MAAGTGVVAGLGCRGYNCEVVNHTPSPVLNKLKHSTRDQCVQMPRLRPTKTLVWGILAQVPCRREPPPSRMPPPRQVHGRCTASRAGSKLIGRVERAVRRTACLGWQQQASY